MISRIGRAPLGLKRGPPNALGSSDGRELCNVHGIGLLHVACLCMHITAQLLQPLAVVRGVNRWDQICVHNPLALSTPPALVVVKNRTRSVIHDNLNVGDALFLNLSAKFWLAGWLAAWLAGWLGAPLRRGVFLRVAALVVGAGVRRLAGRAAAKGIAPPLTYVGMRFPRRLGLPPRPKVRGRGLAKVRQESGPERRGDPKQIPVPARMGRLRSTSLLALGRRPLQHGFSARAAARRERWQEATPAGGG